MNRIPMSRRSLALGAGLVTCGLAPVTLGAVSEYTSYAAWSGITGTSVLGTENFSGFSDYSATASGSAGGVGWNASATGGLYASSVGGSQVMSTNALAPPLIFTFTFAGGLTGVGGNIFATDIDFGVISRTVEVVVGLADSTTFTFTRTIASATDFWAFHSDGSFITSIVISDPAGTGYATMDNLAFMSGGTAPAVPLPGAAGLAAIALAGLSRRRRR
jgi:hypothetical protein